MSRLRTARETEEEAERLLDEAYAVALASLQHRGRDTACLLLKAEILKDMADVSGDVVHQLAISLADEVKELLGKGESMA